MGGVLQQENGKLIFDGCRFENNTAKTDGGVIYATGSADIQIRNCTFTQNSAEARAGGIYASPANITIESCTFDNCSSSNSGSSKYGGAMYLGGGSAYKISNSTIRNCSAKTYGGGIYLTSDNTLLEIENTLFENNTGKTRGGAINLGSASICKINNCSFIGNYTDKWGGALSTNTPASGIYFINNCVFTNNYCSVNQNGSAIWMRGGYLGMNNCSVYNNILEGQTLTDYPSDIRFAVTAEAGGIILNTTVLHGDSNDTGACVSDDLTYVSNATLAEGKVVLMNNAFASNSGTCVQSTTEKGYFVSKGFEYNATDCSQFSKVGDNPWFTSDALVAGAKVSDIKAMLQEEDLFSGIAKTTLGTDFLTWLNGLTVKAGNGTAVGALDYDIAGNARGESAYTPGCYQGK